MGNAKDSLRSFDVAILVAFRLVSLYSPFMVVFKKKIDYRTEISKTGCQNRCCYMI